MSRRIKIEKEKEGPSLRRSNSLEHLYESAELNNVPVAAAGIGEARSASNSPISQRRVMPARVPLPQRPQAYHIATLPRTKPDFTQLYARVSKQPKKKPPVPAPKREKMKVEDTRQASANGTLELFKEEESGGPVLQPPEDEEHSLPSSEIPHMFSREGNVYAVISPKTRQKKMTSVPAPEATSVIDREKAFLSSEGKMEDNSDSQPSGAEGIPPLRPPKPPRGNKLPPPKPAPYNEKVPPPSPSDRRAANKPSVGRFVDKTTGTTTLEGQMTDVDKADNPPACPAQPSFKQPSLELAGTIAAGPPSFPPPPPPDLSNVDPVSEGGRLSMGSSPPPFSPLPPGSEDNPLEWEWQCPSDHTYEIPTLERKKYLHSLQTNESPPASPLESQPDIQSSQDPAPPGSHEASPGHKLIQNGDVEAGSVSKALVDDSMLASPRFRQKQHMYEVVDTEPRQRANSLTGPTKKLQRQHIYDVVTDCTNKSPKGQKRRSRFPQLKPKTKPPPSPPSNYKPKLTDPASKAAPSPPPVTMRKHTNGRTGSNGSPTTLTSPTGMLGVRDTNLTKMSIYGKCLFIDPFPALQTMM